MPTTYVHHATTRPLEAEDLEPVIQHLPLASERAAIRWRVTQGQGPNTAFLIDDQVIAAGGFQLCHAGVGDPWLVMTPEGKQHVRPLYRAIVAWLLEQLEVWQIHRLQSAVHRDNLKAMALLWHLGFHCESTLQQFGPDRTDYYLYAWVRRD
jgi:hypothetical protein